MASASVRQPELVALTSLRGIAALFVLSHHFLFVLLDKLPKIIPSNVFYKSYLWVDLFFVLSGFVLAYVYQTRFVSDVSRRPYREFMWARFARIYPLHLFMLMLFVGFECFQWWLVETRLPGSQYLGQPFTGSETPFALVTNLLLVQTFHWQSHWNQPAWSISAEWLVYFTVPWLIFYIHRMSVRVWLFSAVVAVASLTAIEISFGNLGLEYAGWPMLVRCLAEGILGVTAYQLYRQNRALRFASPVWTSAVLLLNLLFLALPVPAVISVIGFVWLVLCASRIPAGSNHFLAWPSLIYLGEISFAIYMFHWFVLDLLRAGSLYFRGVPLPKNLSLLGEVFVFGAATLVSIVAAMALYHFVETPLRKRLLQRK